MILLHASFSELATPSKLHTSPTATPLAPNFWTNKIQLVLACVTTQSQVPLPLIIVFLTELLHLYSPSRSLRSGFVRHTHAQTPTLQPQNPWLSHFLTLWPPYLEHSLRQDIRHSDTLSSFKSHIVFHSYQSAQSVCVSVCVVCVHLLHSYVWASALCTFLQ